MRSRTGKIRQLNISRRIMLAGILGVSLICIFSGTVFAKYYASKFRQGVSVAAGFYFNSSRLVKSMGNITDITAIATDGMPVSVNTERWTGGNLYFDIPIRNYDNNLLFNDENLNVEYEIVFCLVDDPAGASYYAQDFEGNEVSLEKGTPVKFTNGKLEGGTLYEQNYRLRIHMTDASRYRYARVLVMAYPVAPEYLYKEQDQEFRLLGLFEGVISQAKMKVESAQFVVQTEPDYNAASWSDKVKDLSGLIYNIRTDGDVAADQTNKVEQTVIVKWMEDYLSLNHYDENYRKAKQAQENKSDTEEDILWQKTDAQGSRWTYMKIQVLPYTSVNLTFYKTPQFLNDFASGNITQELFEGLAGAYIEEGAGN